MADDYCSRTLTMPDGSWVRTILRESEMHLTDEQVFERYPIISSFVAQWDSEEASRHGSEEGWPA